MDSSKELIRKLRGNRAPGRMSYSRRKLEASFSKEVDKRDHYSCWEWKGSKSHNGYGIYSAGIGDNRRAHRISWELFFGPIPEGKMVLHKCNNPSCVNPYHLYLGNHMDNMGYMAACGRAKGGGGGKRK